MRIRNSAAFFGLSLLMMGCTHDEFTRFWDNPFQGQARFDPEKAPRAAEFDITRVHSVGAKVLAANEDLQVKPVFFTIGVKEPMLFHQGDNQLIISDGLVKRCETEAELAAVLSHGLAEMVATKQERDGPGTVDRDLPPAPRLTPDVAGSGGSPDMTRAAEEAYASRSRQASRSRPAKQDASVLAKSYLQKSGYDTADYTRVEGLLRDAEKHAADRSFMRQH
jgi:hypothetical protein